MKTYYECGICSCLHPWKFQGDCRDDQNRFAEYSGGEPDPHNNEIDPDDEVRSWEERLEADN